MPLAYSTTRRVEFRDTDAGGIMHFSAFFTMMEEAEHELLRHLGLSVHQPGSDGVVTWPRVHADCDFERPVRFEDVLDVQVTVERIGKKSVTYGVVFACQGQQVARGKLTTVCCRLRPGAPLESINIPADIAARLSQGPQS